MMLKLLELKEYIKQIGDKHGVSVKIFAKLIAAFTIFSLFCTKFGYNAKLNNIAVTLLLSVVAAVTPDMVFAILVCIVSLLNVYPVFSNNCLLSYLFELSHIALSFHSLIYHLLLDCN